MSAILGSKLQKGTTFAALVPKWQGLPEEGRALTVEVDPRTVPYLDHTVEGWVDGPPTSVVAWVMSGREPGADAWRRFTLAKVGPWTYRLDCFPTPFRNGQDPLSPGVPPSSSRPR